MHRVPLALLFAALLGGAPRAFAAPVPAPVAPAKAVAAGDLVRTPVPDLPAGVDEFELLLVPEGGPAVRVSAEQRAGAREIRWRVPAIPFRRARLVLRLGDERSEFESPPSESFELAPLPGSELGNLLGGRSEAGYRILRSERPASGLSPGSDRADFVASHRHTCALKAPGAAGLVAPPREIGPVVFDDARTRSQVPAVPRASLPARTPLRI